MTADVILTAKHNHVTYLLVHKLLYKAMLLSDTAPVNLV
jgi:hypothetical protein